MRTGNGLGLLKKIRFNKYKSFNSEKFNDVYFDNNISLIIGRNNSGKSSIIDVIEEAFVDEGHIFDVGELQHVFMLDEKHIANVFRKDTSGSPLEGNHFEYGKKYEIRNFLFTKKMVILFQHMKMNQLLRRRGLLSKIYGTGQLADMIENYQKYVYEELQQKEIFIRK